MKLLLVHPGASWSTADVEAGLRYGLEQHGVQLVLYRLDGRIDNSGRFLRAVWRRTTKSNPTLAEPTSADVLYHACVGTLERALRHQVDAVLIVSGMYIHPDVVVLLRRAGQKVFVLFTESPYDTDKEVEVAKLVHGCWTMERSVLDRFRAVCPHAGYIPHGWHPGRHDRQAGTLDAEVPAHDVVFVGTDFRERVAFLQAIDWSGIDLGLYGNWESLGSRSGLRPFVRRSAIDNAMTAALYRRAKIGLNLYRRSVGFGKNTPLIEHAESMNPRAYELAACGAFHLSDHRAEVRETFGDLVPTFTTPFEASALIRSWLGDDAGRQRTAAQLPACVAESSWVERSTRVIGDLQSLLGVAQRAERVG